jgi:signal transduction histidine kinase
MPRRDAGIASGANVDHPMRAASRFASVWLVPLLLAAALAVTAALQYRWIGELSDIERDRLGVSVEATARQFASDFDAEVSRLHFAFQRGGGPVANAADAIADSYREWRERAGEPRMLAAVYLVEAPRLLHFDPGRQQLQPVEWPPELQALADRVRAPARGSPVAPRVEHLPALLVPFGGERPAARTSRQWRQPNMLLLRVDRHVLREAVFPKLARRYFSGAGYDVVVCSAHDCRDVLYRSTNGPASRPDVSVPIFHSIPDEPSRSPWVLHVTHRAGSLEAAVQTVRRRNLAVSVAALLVVAATGLALLVALRRAERLRHQQLEFVAGITHELNTPIAAISSAGQNLADGIVPGPDQVARYGTLVAREARRLADTIGHVIEYAGLQRRRQRSEEEVDLQRAIADAIADCAWIAAENEVTVETHVAPLPKIRGEGAALTRAISNLVMNAIRHGAAGKRVDVRAAHDERRAAITIAVEDLGPGIGAADLPHVFEPFYRGSDAHRVPGSGLGLTLVKGIVEEHGGRVRITPRPVRGTIAVIELPAGGKERR